MSLTGKQIGELKSLYESVYDNPEEVKYITEEEYKEYVTDILAIALVESGALDVEFENEELLEQILLEFPGKGLVKKAGDYITKNPKKSLAIATGALTAMNDARKDFLSGKRFVGLRTAASAIKGLPGYIKGRNTMVQPDATGTGNQVVDISGSDVEGKVPSSKDKSTTKYLDKFLKDKRKNLEQGMK